MGRPVKQSDPIGVFGARLGASLREGAFVRLVLSGSSPGPTRPARVLGRLILLKGQAHLSLTFRYPTRDEVQNFTVPDAVDWVLKRLGSEFHNGLLCTSRWDWQICLQPGKRPRLIRHKASVGTPPERQHDHPRALVLDESALDWLGRLGVTDARGQVRPSMAAKHTQINRYLEIFTHLARDAGWIESVPPEAGPVPEPVWTVADMGCGKGYLTFGLWHLLRRVWRLPVQVVGVDCRPELVEAANGVVAVIQAPELQFLCGSIESAPLPAARAFIALHACDVATDAAIRRGIELGAELILVAPCCHKQVRPQLTSPEPLAAILQHGLMKERLAEWLTDGLRSLFLEWAGYRTKLIEFVESEHTPKNLLIAGVLEKTPFAEETARRRIQDLERFFGIRHPLDPLLHRTAATG